MIYDDLINLPRPISKRKKMPLNQRAAQFSPFAALVGHNEAIHETARLTNSKIELDEQAITILNEKLFYLQNHLPCTITITYFINDLHKSGGHYSTITDTLLKIDEINQSLILSNHIIGVYDILEIDFNL